MKFGAFFSVRNVLRTSGVVAVLCGCNLFILPAVATSFLGPRDKSSKDQNALVIFVRSFGIAIAGNGFHALAAVPRRRSLAAALGMEGTILLTNVANLLTNKYEDAGADVKKMLPIMSLNILLVVAQIASLCCGDSSDDAKAGDKTD